MRRHVFIGIGAGLTLLIFYFGIMIPAEGIKAALQQMSRLWYWIWALMIGFGLQAGLFSFIRQQMKRHREAATASVSASGGVSAGSMVACCAHHLGDILPFIGLAGVALFLVKYQTFFIFAGVVSNVVGIIIMLDTIQRHNLCPWVGASRINMRLVKREALILLVPLLAAAFLLSSCSPGFSPAKSTPAAPAGSPSSIPTHLNLRAEVNEEGGVAFQVKPLYTPGKEVGFEITMDTHSGSLDFDLAKLSSLDDGQGDVYRPSKWDGPSGGHHLSGQLVFPALKTEPATLKLTIRDVNGVPERVFTWKVKQ